jgi:hypothetical protein
MTSSSVADRAVPLNAAKQRAAHAVPERSLFLMAFFPRASSPIHPPGVGKVSVCQIPKGRPQGPVNQIMAACHKKGTDCRTPVVFCRNRLISLGLLRAPFSRELAAVIHFSFWL